MFFLTPICPQRYLKEKKNKQRRTIIPLRGDRHKNEATTTFKGPAITAQIAACAALERHGIVCENVEGELGKHMSKKEERSVQCSADDSFQNCVFYGLSHLDTNRFLGGGPSPTSAVFLFLHAERLVFCVLLCLTGLMYIF